MSTSNPVVCKPKTIREKVARDMSWFPECGIERTTIPWNDHPSAIGNAYGNLLVEANLDCEVPFLFRRDGKPIELIYVGRNATDNRVVVQPMTNAVLRSMLFEVGELLNAKGQPIRGRDSWPSTIIEQLMTNLRVDSRIPVLKMLVTSPVLTKSGWLEETSFDPDAGILARIEPGAWRPVDLLGTGNSPEEIAEACHLARMMFQDTKTPEPGALATLLGNAISIVGRPLFGNVPLMSFESGDFGPGKTATAEAIGTVCLSPGEWTVVSCEDFDGSATEMNKRISDALTGLYRYVVVDDPKEGVPFNHSDLATLLTSRAGVKIRTFGKLGGKDSGTMVYPNQTVAVCANNPDYSARFTSRVVRTVFDAMVPDGRKIKWEIDDYDSYVSAHRHDFNWAIRLLLDEAHRVLSTPEDRAVWSKWFSETDEANVRANFKEWLLHCAVVAGFLDVEAGSILGDQIEYETPTDSEAETRNWIVQRLIALGATDEAGSVPAGALIHLDDGKEVRDDSPFASAEAVSLYLRKHAGGKSGHDEDGNPWLIRKAKRVVQKRGTWMALASK